jgi:uncharacterized protein (TIGR03084 family)
VLTATDPDAYAEIRRDTLARRAAGMSLIEETRDRLRGLHGRSLLAVWRQQFMELCAVLDAAPADQRFQWNKAKMSLRMFATARQMEHWAHAQAIYDIFGMNRAYHERLKNVAVIGVKTYGFTFTNRDLPVPGNEPYVRLTSPSGEIWEWNDPVASSSVVGSAVEFCQVVTQTRNVADTDLMVSGSAARAWMAIAQCFGGVPNDPPAKGTRFVVNAPHAW